MLEKANNRLEAWLDDGSRIVSFHEIPDSQHYSAEGHCFWPIIVSLVMAGYQVQSYADLTGAARRLPACGLPFGTDFFCTQVLICPSELLYL